MSGNSADRRRARRENETEGEEAVRRAQNELREDGVLSVDTFAALNCLGIDPDTIEVN